MLTKVRNALQKLKLHPDAINAVDVAIKRWEKLTIKATGDDVGLSEVTQGNVSMGTMEGNAYIKVTLRLVTSPSRFINAAMR